MPDFVFVIIHGTGGSPKSNWFPWIKEKLEASGNKVIIPTFPTLEGQNLQSWWGVFQKETVGIDPEKMVLIGHSMGGPLVLRLAEKTKTPYRAIYAVAPFDRLLNCDYDPYIKTFVEPPFDWSAVKNGAQILTLLAGDNDPYIPLNIPQEMAERLGLTLQIIKDGGHLNAEFNYTAFPALYELLERDIMLTNKCVMS